MNFLENFLLSIRSWWQNDPNSRIKALFIAGTIIFVLILGYGVYYINFALPTNDFNYNLGNSSQVTTKNFDNAARLDRISTSLIGNSHTFVYQNDRQITFDSNQKLNINFAPVSNSPVFDPLSIYNTKDVIIINESAKTTLYHYDSKNFEELEGTTFLTPEPSSNNFWYLQTSNGTTQLRQQNDLAKLAQGNLISYFSPVIKPALIETRLLNNKLYVIAWSNLNRSGTLEIWNLDSGNLTQSQSINDVNSFSYGENDLLYSTSDNQQAMLISFKNSVTGQKTILKVDEELAKRNLKGIFAANRCTIDSSESVTCLIKKNAVSYVDYTQADAIMQFSPKVNDMKILFEGLNLSGKNIFGYEGKYYIIGQENSLLYRVKA